MKGISDYHEVVWTEGRIARFWQFYAQNTAAHESYFSKQLGGAILRFVNKYIRPAPPVLDLGCGPGFLVTELVKSGLSCVAIDSSPESIASLRRLAAGEAGVLEILVGSVDRVPLADGRVGCVFLVEVLEHLSPDLSDRTIAEAARVLRPGGHVVITVPNEEDLDARKIACPDCGCVFHRVQHLQSLDAVRLKILLADHRLEPVLIASLNLGHYADGVPLARIRRRVAPKRTRKDPHLIAIAVKSTAA
ncbi:MAG TPA: class I SAM-dependent methyltransferase [Thermoanaerobaculia bacterium]|nr:class I SAM-dependent methyltransferase [Thermoanaerobaculia bacterium]